MVKRKPIPLVPPPVKSRKRARKIVTSFHKITKEAEEVASSAATDGEKANHLERLQRELEEMGGRQAYQSASLLSASFHNTSKWVTQLLTKMNLRPQRGQPPLKVLEVGAINTRLLDIPWLDVRAIDLKSQHERIEERDFFSLRPAGEYDVVSSSMVINCVPTAKRRGEMLAGYRAHLRPGGHLFLMLPLLCLTNSNHTTRASFVEILQEVGFTVRVARDSPKVAFFCATAGKQPSTPISRENRSESSGERSKTQRMGSTKAGGCKAMKEAKHGHRGKNDFAITL